MANIGLKDLFIAPITENEGVETYGTPERLAKAISADLSINVAQAVLYADDGADEVVNEFVDGDLKLMINDLTPQKQAKLLGQTLEGESVVYANEADLAPYFAVGFRAKKPGGKFKYVWLYKVKFGVPSESYKTKGESIEFTTPEITGKIIKNDKGDWKVDAVVAETDPIAAAWFTAVKEKTPAGP